MMIQEDIVDAFIRYGLFIGALFQLVCIGAVIIMPDVKSDYFQEGANESWSDDEPGGSSSTSGIGIGYGMSGSSCSGCSSDSGGSPSPSNSSPAHSSRSFKLKKERKKRR